VYDPGNGYGITGIKDTKGKNLSPAPPIKAELVGYKGDEKDVKIEWRIGAVASKTARTYGGIYDVYYGVTNARVAAPTIGTNRCSVGTDGKQNTSAWESGILSLSDARKVTFRPCPPSHNTIEYKATGGGTKGMDGHRKNPRLAYKVSATIYKTGGSPKSLGPVIAKMDEIDMIRQEYITHYASADALTSYTTSGNAMTATQLAKLKASVKSKVKVPTRDKVVLESSLTEGYWASYTNTDNHTGYAYQYVVEDGMVKMWEAYKKAFDTYSAIEVITGTTPNTATFTFPAGVSMRVNSAYRNPERNEAIGSKPDSTHMLGRALDIGATGLALRTSSNAADKLKRGQAFYKIWRSINIGLKYKYKAKSTTVTTADFWQLEGDGPWDVKVKNGETGSFGWQVLSYGEDRNHNGILDGYEQVGHLHMQDNP